MIDVGLDNMHMRKRVIVGENIGKTLTMGRGSSKLSAATSLLHVVVSLSERDIVVLALVSGDFLGSNFLGGKMRMEEEGGGAYYRFRGRVPKAVVPTTANLLGMALLAGRVGASTRRVEIKDEGARGDEVARVKGDDIFVEGVGSEECDKGAADGVFAAAI
ncbi:uncharacterized protein G2W53_036126 [Senna tora]|uniref:Uncharacterized protein n=1 Tax=Senna tora TaxID=362788 RepID=A0A834STX4_9FABA|nr:uncharacterized protein G2W53_036126 [Senna tora]